MDFDLTSLISSALLSGNTVDSVAKSSKASKNDVTNVLTAALPALLSSVAGGKNPGMLGNLANLLDNDDDDDNEDATKNSILTALLGKTELGKLLTSVSDKLGIDSKVVSGVLIAAAPVILKKIMSLVSTDTSAESEKKPSGKSSSSSKKSDSKKTDSKKTESKKTESKKTESKKSESKKTDKSAQEEILTDLAESLIESLVSNKK